MTASASIEAEDVPLGRASVAIGVYRLRSGQFELLPNVRVLTVQSREGADPGVAQFRYVFDSGASPAFPNSFEQVLAVDSDLPSVVQNDERIVVMTSYPDGSPLFLFDGFAQVPELGFAPSREEVSFAAYGVAVREWDTPIGGALLRDSDRPSTGPDRETDIVAQFNPQGRPNATPDGAQASDTFGNLYPTFLDPLVVRAPDVRRKWTVPMALRYLCFHENDDQTYVGNPAGDLIDALFDSRAPGEGVGLHLDDPTSYESSPLDVPDYPVTGKAWPNAVDDLLRPNGFGMAFRLDDDGTGMPSTRLDLFRRQDGSPAIAKDLLLQPRGQTLDPSLTNMNAAKLARDTRDIANAFTVESELVRYEASFILAPGFPIDPKDAASPTSLAAFDLSSPTFAGSGHDNYRLYMFDETGEGHWDWATSAIVTNATDLTAILQAGDLDMKPCARRRRVPIGDLFSLDPNRKALRASLSISTNYLGTQPGLWNGTGTWQQVQGGFELLRDRLGIWIKAANPNGWSIGGSSAPNAPYPAGVVRGVEDQAVTGRQRFALRLTCVVEGDHVLSATADRRPSSSTTFRVTRRVDGRDRYFKHLIAPNSEFNPSSSIITSRDDSVDAKAEADARRLASESGEVGGSVTVPRFTNAYQIGDRIRSIRGRNLSLRTNAGAPSEEGEVYPAVVGLTWVFDGGQKTILHLSDD